jgi:TRAP-type C4-dicarboxylate transport system permease small subunit
MKDLLTTLAVAEINPVDDGDGDLISSVTGIINAVIAVLGIVCVIVIIMGGVSYMTSSGDAGKVKKAKDTILYGVIGLIVCALAAVIVNFVITTILQNA